MAVRRVFVISSGRLTAYHLDGAKLLEPFSFDAGEEGLERYARYLDRCPRDVTYVVADLVEEEFREESIPHVPAWDRRSLLRARSLRAFRDARCVHSAMLGREPGGRRDDRVLFSAITRPALLDPWLAPMARRSVPLAGIHSPAMLTRAMLTAIGAQGEGVLVVSLQSGGGLRQTFFRDGRCRLSRLAAVPEPEPGRVGSEILDEVARTQRYLNSLEASEGDGRLDIRILGHGTMLDDLRRELPRVARNDPRAACVAVDLADVARRLGLRRWDGEATADRLFVHVLAKRAPRNHYATRAEIRTHSTLQARSFLNIASAVMLAGGCLLGGIVFLEGVIVDGHARSLAKQAALGEDRYRVAQAELPQAPAEPFELERVVSAVDVLRRRRADPVEFLASISEALAGFPRVRIEGLSWRLSDDAEGPVAGADRAEAERVEPNRSGEEQRRDTADLFQLSLVSARIEPFDGDYRGAFDTIQRFADALAASSAKVEHVRILSLPLDLSPEQTLAGDAGAIAGNADFEIRMALRVGAPVETVPEPMIGCVPGTKPSGPVRPDATTCASARERSDA